MQSALDQPETTSLDDASEATLRQMLLDSQRRVGQLARRVTTKDRELVVCVQQLEQLRAHTVGQSAGGLKFAAVDPAVGVTLGRMRRDLADCKERLEQTQADLSACKFTPDSQTGKRLMARIRQMQQENGELSRGVSSGGVAKLHTEIALQKMLLQDMRRTQAEQDEFLTEIDTETETLQATVVQLQTQLRDACGRIQALEQHQQRLAAAVSGVGGSAGSVAAAAVGVVAAASGYDAGCSGAASSTADAQQDEKDQEDQVVVKEEESNNGANNTTALAVPASVAAATAT